MHFVLVALLALQSATITDIQSQTRPGMVLDNGVVLNDHRVTLSLQIGDIIYSAEFSRHALKPESLIVGDQVQAEVKDGKMMVQRKDGKTVSARIIRQQRVTAHPQP